MWPMQLQTDHPCGEMYLDLWVLLGFRIRGKKLRDLGKVLTAIVIMWSVGVSWGGVGRLGKPPPNPQTPQAYDDAQRPAPKP